MKKTIVTCWLGALLVSTIATVGLWADDRLTVTDPVTSAIKFRVTSDGNVTGASFTGAPTDGAAISIQQGPTEAGSAVKFAVADNTGAQKIIATSDGRMGIGTGTLSSVLDVQSKWSGSSPLNLITAGTSYGDAARYTIRRANGTVSAPVALAVNDVIGTVNFRGHDGTNFSPGGLAAIFAIAADNFTPTSQPTHLYFTTTASGSTSALEKMRITSSGNVGIGATDPTQLLDVNGNGIRIRTSKTPASSTATCNQGEMAWDAGYVYVCVATNSWKRAGLATW